MSQQQDKLKSLWSVKARPRPFLTKRSVVEHTLAQFCALIQIILLTFVPKAEVTLWSSMCLSPPMCGPEIFFVLWQKSETWHFELNWLMGFLRTNKDLSVRKTNILLGLQCDRMHVMQFLRSLLRCFHWKNSKFQVYFVTLHKVRGNYFLHFS